MPSTGTQWLLLLVLGAPAFVILSVVGDVVGEAFNRLPGIRQGNEYVERRTRRVATSGTRIYWHLFTLLFSIALILCIAWVAQRYFERVRR